MSTTENKIDAILDAISQDIAKQELKAEHAMHNIEMLNATSNEFKEANIQFSASMYVAGYLTRIQSVVMERQIKKAENVIRYHAYYQHTKGGLDNGQDVLLGQATIAAILDGYVEQFFK